MLLLRLVAGIVALVVAGAPVRAGAPAFDLAHIFAREPLTGRLPSSITWSPDGTHFLYTLPGGARGPLDTRIYEVRTHASRTFFRANPDGRGSRPAPEFVWSPDGTRLAYLDGGALWTIGLAGTRPRRIAGDADDPQWSPDGTRIAFVRGNDLAVVDVRSGAVRALSHDGTDTAGNASPDWVYSEELDMRHAFRWSPDGRAIAYLHVDDGPVSAYPILVTAPYRNRVSMQRYPNAGEANPIVTVRVVRLGDGVTRTLFRTSAHDDYVSWVGFTGANVPAAELLNRAQTDRRIVAFEPAMRTLFAEHDAHWIERAGDPLVVDAHRLAIVARDGSTNVVRVVDTLHGGSRRIFAAIAIASLAAVDVRRERLFVAASAPTRRDETAFAVTLDGSGARAFDTTAGTHRYAFAPHGNAFVERSASFTTPPDVAVGTSIDAPRITIARSTPLDPSIRGQMALLEVPSRFGPLDAWIMRPPDFDPGKRYPVVMDTYGGPQTPTTLDDWGGQGELVDLWFAQHGYLVFSIDGPGSQIDGTGARRYLDRALGPGALAGQLEGARYLKTLPYVDPERLAIWGWSFGGYLTAYALTHAPDVWKAGFAVGTVTDWRRYDTIYTERYRGLPQRNPRAYADSSVMPAAARLRGALELAHGTADDNVHVANTYALATALTNAGRPYELVVYPEKRHGIDGIAAHRDLFGRMLRFWQTHL